MGASVGASVGESVGLAVGASVGLAVGASVEQTAVDVDAILRPAASDFLTHTRALLDPSVRHLVASDESSVAVGLKLRPPFPMFMKHPPGLVLRLAVTSLAVTSAWFKSLLAAAVEHAAKSVAHELESQPLFEMSV